MLFFAVSSESPGFAVRLDVGLLLKELLPLPTSAFVRTILLEVVPVVFFC
jgi:hypothetical protein